MYPIRLTQSQKVTHTSQRGFTLIELMIVIAMMMLVIALVAPMGVNMVDKAKAQTEYIQLQGFLKKQSTEAFLSSQTIFIDIYIDHLMYGFKGSPKQLKHFNSLSFPQPHTTFFFNRTGLASHDKITVNVGNVQRDLSLANLWDN